MGLLAPLYKWSYWYYHIYSGGQGDKVGAGRVLPGCCQDVASALGDRVWAEKTPIGVSGADRNDLIATLYGSALQPSRATSHSST